jgi:hypothetical protein
MAITSAGAGYQGVLAALLQGVNSLIRGGLQGLVLAFGFDPGADLDGRRAVAKDNP